MIELKNLQQGSLEWHDFRQEHIGASDSSVLMGCGYMSEYQLYENKLGLYEVPVNDAMRRGSFLEDQARFLYIEKTGVSVEPLCVKSSYYTFMAASLDGISEDRKTLVEIKTGGKKTEDMVKSGKIPDNHFAQCQHQLAVTELPEMDYCFFDGIDITLLKIKRDDAYINKLIQLEQTFWKRVLTFDPPEPDLEEIEDPIFLSEIQIFKDLQEKLKKSEAEAEAQRQLLISLACNRSVKGNGVTIRKSVRKGTVDYKAIPELEGVDLEKYRKKPSEFWTVK
jgi:putative phage-type endonuclease